MILPAFLHRELRWHLESYAEAGPDGLLFVGEKGAPFRRSTFGRKGRRAREIVGMPEGFQASWHGSSRTRQLTAMDSTKARVSDLGLCHGAGDEKRTRTLSLGSDGAWPVGWLLNWDYVHGRGVRGRRNVLLLTGVDRS